MDSNILHTLSNFLINFHLDEYNNIINKNLELLEFKHGIWNPDNIGIMCINSVHKNMEEFLDCPCKHFTRDFISIESSLLSSEEMVLIKSLIGRTKVHPSTLFSSLIPPDDHHTQFEVSVGRSRENNLCFLYGPNLHRKHGIIIYDNFRTIYKDTSNNRNVSWIKNSESCTDNEEDTQDRVCIVCMSNPRTVVFKPCFHFAICSECLYSLEERCTENKCIICKEKYMCTVDVNTQNDDMRTMVPDNLRGGLNDRHVNSNQVEKIMEEMGFHPVGKGGEVIKKGTQIAFHSTCNKLRVDIPTIVSKIEKCDDIDETLQQIFEHIKKFNINITFEDVKLVWDKWEYNIEKTLSLLLNKIKAEVTEIFIINVE